MNKIWLERIYNNIGLQDSPMSYPFENLWYAQKTIPELCLALPSNAHIQRYVSRIMRTNSCISPLEAWSFKP